MKKIFFSGLMIVYLTLNALGQKGVDILKMDQWSINYSKSSDIFFSMFKDIPKELVKSQEHLKKSYISEYEDMRKELYQINSNQFILEYYDSIDIKKFRVSDVRLHDDELKLFIVDLGYLKVGDKVNLLQTRFPNSFDNKRVKWNDKKHYFISVYLSDSLGNLFDNAMIDIEIDTVSESICSIYFSI